MCDIITLKISFPKGESKMKKIVSLIMFCCVTLLAGVCLTACTGMNRVFFSQDESTAEYVSLNFYIDGILQENIENNSFKINDNVPLKVEIVANQLGVDFSSFEVKVNGTTKQVVENNKYSSFSGGESLTYGYFILNLTDNTKIEFSGAKMITSTFSFEAKNLEDEDVVEKLKMTSVCMTFEDLDDETGETEANYTNLYNLVTSETPLNFAREFDGNTTDLNKYSAFRVKFDGINPFNLENVNPFKIRQSDSIIENAVSINQLDDYYIVNVGNLAADTYKIVVDFAGITYTDFLVSKPDDNMTYTISMDTEILSYDKGATVVVTKLLDSSVVDYTNLTAYINALELEKISEDNEAKTVTFKVPNHLTPLSCGGYSVFRISVGGYEYLKTTHILRANSTEKQTPQAIVPSLWAVNDNGDKIGICGINESGAYVSWEGQRNAVVWSYQYNESVQAYYSKFDLYNYDITVGNITIMNVAKEIDGATEDVIVDLESGYKFRAYYNTKTGIFDSFQLEFVCSADAIFEFCNFQEFSKNIKVSYSFEDPRVTSVEYALVTTLDGSTNIEWHSLKKDETAMLTVSGENYIFYRLTSERSTMASYEFTISNQLVCDTRLSTITESGDECVYTIFRFEISNAQFTTTEDFKLVLSGTN